MYVTVPGAEASTIVFQKLQSQLHFLAYPRGQEKNEYLPLPRDKVVLVVDTCLLQHNS
jgi:hypothetical protein